MRRLCIVLAFLLLLSACSNRHEYDGWQEIELSGVGTCKIPQEWVYHEDEGIVYITDKNMDESSEYQVYLMGAIYENRQGVSFSQLLSQLQGKEIEFLEPISSEVFSNSATVGNAKYLVDGQSCEMIFLELYSTDKSLDAFVCDPSIAYDLVEKVGKSFSMDD